MRILFYILGAIALLIVSPFIIMMCIVGIMGVTMALMLLITNPLFWIIAFVIFVVWMVFD
jgi:hypothetical protein